MARADAGTQTITAIHQEIIDAANRRDWEAIRSRYAPDVVYTDHARGETIHGVEAVIEDYRAWTEAFSDGRIEEAVFDQAGDLSVARFIGRGTQDGPLGPFPPTGEMAETSFCDVARFNDDGQIVAEDFYYDQLSMLTQLGHIPDLEG